MATRTRSLSFPFLLCSFCWVGSFFLSLYTVLEPINGLLTLFSNFGFSFSELLLTRSFKPSDLQFSFGSCSFSFLDFILKENFRNRKLFILSHFCACSPVWLPRKNEGNWVVWRILEIWIDWLLSRCCACSHVIPISLCLPFFVYFFHTFS